MKIIGKLCLVACLAGVSSSALANCWEECVLPNPFGGCGKKVKMCDIENPGRAAASLGNDIKDAENRLVANWHNSWGELPGPLRTVLEDYPITIACTIFPETRGYALVIGALEGIVSHAKSRAEQAAPIVQSAPEWKRNGIANGQRYLVALEIGKMNVTDFNAPDAQPFRDKYAQPYSNFLSCMQNAQDIKAGASCQDHLEDDAYAVRHQQ